MFLLLWYTFPTYRCKRFIYAYWGISLAAFLCVASGAHMTPLSMPPAVVVRLAVAWLAAQCALFLLLPFCALGKAALCRTGKDAATFSRRCFLKGLGIAIPVFAVGYSGYGAWSAARQIVWRKYDVAVYDLADELVGYTVAQLSDVHIGLFFSTERLDALISDIARQKPQALVITGDLIDAVEEIEHIAAVLEKHCGEFLDGIWFCWGNHEYFRDFPAIQNALSKTRVHILRNENALLKDASRPFYILGIDYPWAREAEQQAKECRAMLKKSLSGVPESAVKLLLTHHPAVIDAAFARKIDLTLAGHTHGGQIAIFGVNLLPLHYKYLRGLYRQGDETAYVNSGAGSWFPLRIGCPAEVVFFRLMKKEIAV